MTDKFDEWFRNMNEWRGYTVSAIENIKMSIEKIEKKLCDIDDDIETIKRDINDIRTQTSSQLSLLSFKSKIIGILWGLLSAIITYIILKTLGG